MDFSTYTYRMRYLTPGLLVVLLASGCVQHIASDQIAIVFRNPITYGAVETDMMTVAPARMWPNFPIGGETMSDRAKRCGWSEDDLELRRFRHLFLLYFKQGYSSRIGARNAQLVSPVDRSRMPPPGSGYSVISFILVERPDDPQAVSIVPRPDYAAWLVLQTLYLKHGGRVSIRYGWLPVDALRKEVEVLEQGGEIKFFDSGYRKRLWRYFDSLGESEFASHHESEEYFRMPWWSKPLAPERNRLVGPKRSLSPSPCISL